MYQVVSSPAEFDAERYAREGAAVFKGAYAQEPLFQRYRDDLAWCAKTLLQDNGASAEGDLEMLLLRLYRTKGTDLQSICHLATLPNKFASGGALKHAPSTLSIVETVLGKGAVIGTPAGSDTLHVFVGEPEFDKYILPIHQDYPYLLQSPHALTLWVPIVGYSRGAGGMYVWPGSHTLGIHTSTRQENGAFATVIDEKELDRFPKVALEWDLGDIVVMDTHMLHQGIPNRTDDHLRVTQLFRYSDLRDPLGIRTRWSSTPYARKGLAFEDVHPELFIPTV